MSDTEYSDTVINPLDIIKRAAEKVINCADFEADMYEGQSPVEDWALATLEYALMWLNAKDEDTRSTALTTMQHILDEYEELDWDTRIAKWQDEGAEKYL